MRYALWVVLLQTAVFAVDLALPPAIQDGFRIGLPGLSGQSASVSVNNIGVDGNGDLYLAGTTIGNPFDGGAPTLLGPVHGYRNLFVAKVSAVGQQLLYVTQIGGSGTDSLETMAVDHDGNVFLAGSTTSTDFPVTTGAFRSTFTNGSAFVLKLDSSGKNLVFGTFFDDSRETDIKALAIDASGNVYVAGHTDGQTIPITAAAYMRSGMDLGFVSKFSSDGRRLLFSTLFGGAQGSGYVSAIALDATGAMHIAGWDWSQDFPVTAGGVSGAVQGPTSYFAILDPTASQLVYSTRIADPFAAVRIVVDGKGNSYVAGSYVTKFDPTGALVFTKDIGDGLTDLVLLNDGSVVVGGGTTTPSFPTRDSLQPCTANLPNDPALPMPNLTVSNAVVVKLDPDGNIVHSSLLGLGSYNYIAGLALAPNGSLYLAGGTNSPIFPGGPTLVPAASGIFAFGFRLDWQQIPTGGLPAPACLAQDATLAPAPAAPLLIATLFGSNLGPIDGVQFGIGADGLVATELAGTRVTVGGLPAPILYAQDQQINFVVPGGLTGSTTEVCVERAGETSCLFAYVAPFAPGIFSEGGSSAVQNQDGTLNTPDNPATRGSIVAIYGTGFGPYSSAVPDGSVAQLLLNPLKYPVQAFFSNSAACIFFPVLCYPGPPGTVSADVLFAGASPLLVSGVTVFVVKIPDGVYSPPYGGGLELSISTGGSPNNFTSTTTLTVAIQ